MEQKKKVLIACCNLDPRTRFSTKVKLQYNSVVWIKFPDADPILSEEEVFKNFVIPCVNHISEVFYKHSEENDVYVTVFGDDFYFLYHLYSLLPKVLPKHKIVFPELTDDKEFVVNFIG